MGIVCSCGRRCRTRGRRLVSFRDVRAHTGKRKQEEEEEEKEESRTICRDSRFASVVNWACNVFGGLLLSAAWSYESSATLRNGAERSGGLVRGQIRGT